MSERAQALEQAFRDGFDAAQRWGCDMASEAYAEWAGAAPPVGVSPQVIMTGYRSPASISPVEPTPEPLSDEPKETPRGARIFRHVCGTPEDDGECMACSQIDCPDGEPLHYHHDGCPCCSQKPSVEPAPPPPAPCVWREDGKVFHSGCGARLAFSRMDPLIVGRLKFCGFCGHPIEITR